MKTIFTKWRGEGKGNGLLSLSRDCSQDNKECPDPGTENDVHV